MHDRKNKHPFRYMNIIVFSYWLLSSSWRNNKSNVNIWNWRKWNSVLQKNFWIEHLLNTGVLYRLTNVMCPDRGLGNLAPRCFWLASILVTPLLSGGSWQWCMDMSSGFSLLYTLWFHKFPLSPQGWKPVNPSYYNLIMHSRISWNLSVLSTCSWGKLFVLLLLE